MTGKTVQCILFALAICQFPAATPAAAGEDQITKGLEFARENCRFCHVIGPENPYGGIGSTPSFYIFAENWERYEERLATFYVRNPHPSRLKQPALADHENLMTYIKQLKRPAKTE